MTKPRSRALLAWVVVIAVPAWLVSCDREAATELIAAATQSKNQAAQRRTVADLRNIGTAMMSWLTDQLGAAAAGQETIPPYDVRQIPSIPREELQGLLVPDYLETLPELDGWGHPYEFRLNTSDPLAQHVMTIRSPGRDGKFSGDVYEVGGFEPEQYDDDVVWADGFFVRWPQRPESR